jgi:hypothetical protein
LCLACTTLHSSGHSTIAGVSSRPPHIWTGRKLFTKRVGNRGAIQPKKPLWAKIPRDTYRVFLLIPIYALAIFPQIDNVSGDYPSTAPAHMPRIAELSGAEQIGSG